MNLTHLLVVEVPKKALNACDMFVFGPTSDLGLKSHFGTRLVRPTFIKDLFSNVHVTGYTPARQDVESPTPNFDTQRLSTLVSVYPFCLLLADLSLAHFLSALEQREVCA
jgi:hypothetical protein